MTNGLSSCVRNKVRLITFNNTRKKNALSPQAYSEIANTLNADAIDDNITGVIFTGQGDYFTSGNDLTSKTNENMDYEETTKDFHGKFVAMVDAFLSYPKIIACVVNGPAIGIGFTLSGLADVVIASENATFSAPFVKLGLCIEGCGSFLMPRILGKSKATEIMLLGEKINAQEAQSFNLVSKIIPKQNIATCIDELVEKLSNLPLEQIMFNKKLVSDGTKNDLLLCAKREADILLKCLSSEYFITSMMNFMQRKRQTSKL